MNWRKSGSENRVRQTYPPYKNLVPKIPKLGAKKVRKLISEIVFTLPLCFGFGVVAPLNLEILDGAASSESLCFIQNADWPLVIGEIRLKVNGLVINVLIRIGMTWRLETLPKL